MHAAYFVHCSNIYFVQLGVIPHVHKSLLTKKTKTQ